MINIQNLNDNECFQWFIVRYLNPADYDPARIRKINELLADKSNFEDIKFLFKIKDVQKKEKKNSIGISGYKNQKQHPIYI